MKKIILISIIASLGLASCASTCKEGDPGYPKCPTGGGASGPISGGNN